MKRPSLTMDWEAVVADAPAPLDVGDDHGDVEEEVMAAAVAGVDETAFVNDPNLSTLDLIRTPTRSPAAMPPPTTCQQIEATAGGGGANTTNLPPQDARNAHTGLSFTDVGNKRSTTVPPFAAVPTSHGYSRPATRKPRATATSYVSKGRPISENTKPHHKRKKTMKQPRPLPPKRPMSAYSFFHRHHHQQQRAAASTLHVQWESLSPPERQRYDRMAQEDLQRYRREMAHFTRHGGTRGRTPKEVTPDSKEQLVWTTPMMMGVPPPPVSAIPSSPMASSPYRYSGNNLYSPPSSGTGVTVRMTTPHSPAPSYRTPPPISDPYRAAQQPVPTSPNFPHAQQPHKVPPSPAASRHPPYSQPSTPTAFPSTTADDLGLDQEELNKLTGPPPMGTVPLPSDSQLVMADPVTGDLQKYTVSYAVWTMPESSAKEYFHHVLSLQLEQQQQRPPHAAASAGVKSSGMVSIPRTVMTGGSTPFLPRAEAIPMSPPVAGFSSI